VMNIDFRQMFFYVMTGEWFDVSKGFDLAAAVCKLKKHSVIERGSAMRNLEIQKEKCVNPYAWIPSFISLVILSCCGGGCYTFYRCKVLSRDRDAHDIVLYKQQEFLLSNQSHPIVPVVHYAPCNQANPGFGQEGVPQYVNIPQHATIQPDSIQLNHYGNQGVSNAGPAPPAYDPKL